MVDSDENLNYRLNSEDILTENTTEKSGTRVVVSETPTFTLEIPIVALETPDVILNLPSDKFFYVF
jgi:hypothetical protein